MKTTSLIFQRMKRPVGDKFELAQQYYALLSTINNLHLTKREVQLVAFTAINGNMSYSNIKEEFCKKYNTTVPTINNLICKLKKMKVLVKQKDKVKVNPQIVIDFTKALKLEINFVHDGAE